jgi:DNA-binding transcriptional MerR regulator
VITCSTDKLGDVVLNTKQAAEKLGTDARTLRRFIRQDSTYSNAGSGGRYEFTDKDIPTLKKRFSEWQNSSREKAPERSRVTANKGEMKMKHWNDNDSPMPVSMLGRKLTRSERDKRDAASRARVDRLEEALRASGKHISQYSNWGEKADV